MTRRDVFAVVLGAIFAIGVAGQANQTGKQAMSNLPDEPLLIKLSSADAAKATAAAREIFKRGKRIIPRLMELKNDRTRSQFLSLCSSDPRSSDFSARLEGTEGSWVTTEVVAIYLISAIYFENPRFAGEPLLQGGRRIKDYNYNSRKRVKKAWKTVSGWYSRMQRVGIEDLRKRNDSPLGGSKLSFLNTDPKRSWQESDCAG